MPTGFIDSHTTPTSPAEDCGHSWSRLDISALYKAVQFYYKHSLAPSTRELYTYGIQRYLQFCNLINHPPLPTSEQTLLLFTTHLALQHLSTSTIQTYLSAVRYLHLSTNHLTAYTTQLTPRVQQVLRGIKRHQAGASPAIQRLPITIDIMHQIKTVLQQQPNSYHNILMWATCYLAFFGFLLCNEFTVPSQRSYDPAAHLSYSDIAVDDCDNPSLVVIYIKKSKTDPYRRGTSITLGATRNEICLVKALMLYLARRGSQAGPLFICENQQFLTQQAFRSHLMKLLQDLNLDPSCYNTYSFRIGAATSAEAAGLTESQIKSLGRLRSNAYRCYIKPTHSQLATFSTLLVSQGQKNTKEEQS